MKLSDISKKAFATVSLAGLMSFGAMATDKDGNSHNDNKDKIETVTNTDPATDPVENAFESGLGSLVPLSMPNKVHVYVQADGDTGVESAMKWLRWIKQAFDKKNVEIDVATYMLTEKNGRHQAPLFSFAFDGDVYRDKPIGGNDQFTVEDLVASDFHHLRRIVQDARGANFHRDQAKQKVSQNLNTEPN